MHKLISIAPHLLFMSFDYENIIADYKIQVFALLRQFNWNMHNMSKKMYINPLRPAIVYMECFQQCYPYQSAIMKLAIYSGLILYSWELNILFCCRHNHAYLVHRYVLVAHCDVLRHLALCAVSAILYIHTYTII